MPKQIREKAEDQCKFEDCGRFTEMAIAKAEHSPEELHYKMDGDFQPSNKYCEDHNPANAWMNDK